jgi:hypothetical protein
VVGTYTQARQRGEVQRMSFGRFGEETAIIAGVGGFGRAMGTEAEYAAQTRMMAAFGGRYEANPGAAYAEYYGRQQGPKSEMGETLNWEALTQVMRANPQGIQWGTRRLNPRTSMTDQEILMSEGAEIPEYRAAQFAVAMRRAGGNRELAMVLLGESTSAQTPAQRRIEFETLEKQAAMPGGIAGQFRAPGAAQTGEAVVAGREGRPYRPGQDILERQMTPEELAQTGLVKGLEDARTTMLKAIQDTAAAFNTSKDAGEALGKIFGDLWSASDKLKTMFEIMALIPGLGMVGMGGTAAITALQNQGNITNEGTVPTPYGDIHVLPPGVMPWLRDQASRLMPRKTGP